MGVSGTERSLGVGRGTSLLVVIVVEFEDAIAPVERNQWPLKSNCSMY